MLDEYEHRPIKGYDGLYSITKCGKVYSHRSDKFMSQRISEYGYCLIVLKNHNNYSSSFRVHRLVADAFIPNPDWLEFVNHKDADRTNNNVDNLEWVTHKQNVEHMFKMGRNPKTQRKRLSFDTVQEIRQRYVLRCPFNGRLALAAEYDVSPETIRRIVNGYAYLKEPKAA